METDHRFVVGSAFGVMAALALGCGASPAIAAPNVPVGPMQVTVDARDASLGRLRSHVVVPARPGELALVYPKWIPGEHGPTGPITDMIGVHVSAGGKPLAWHRNPDEMYEIDVTVPAGATSVEVDFESVRTSSSPFGGSAAASSRFVDVVWNQALVYPKGARSSALLVDASVKLPKGFKYATALTGGSEHDGTVSFGRVTLETLVDSPLLAGAYLKTYELGVHHGANHALAAVGENADSVIAPPEQVESWKRLTAEANALFGARHYDSYLFLLLMSDSVPTFGLEHHASSENYVKERSLLDGDLRRVNAVLLPHEFAHSWNGKYRRPSGLATPNYQEPMRGELLWVYEGLTEYLGWVLAARSGMASLDDSKVDVARASLVVDTAGRSWRPLADTTAAAQLLYNASETGASQRRRVDFYPEGLLIWLEADVIIRQKTNGARSLDDFCQRFHGGKDSVAEVHPYTLDDVVKTLGTVLPYDWKGFFDERVYQVAPKVPHGGLEAAGYKIALTDKKPEIVALREKAFKFSSYVDTLGFYTNEENVVQDVRDGSPAARGGLSPRMKLIAVDSRKLSSEVMSDAIAHAKSSTNPIELLVELDGWYRTIKIDYRGGEHYRVLERDPSKPDLLAAILAPKTAPLTASAVKTP